MLYHYNNLFQKIIMESKPQGSGSIWNVNSWHWESKNYAQISKKLIEQKLKSLILNEKELKIVTSKIKFLKAEAEVNIRKGKQYLVYDFSIEIDYKAEDGTNAVEGSYRVKEINQDDLDDIIVDEVKTNDKSKLSDRVKSFLKKGLKGQFIKIFKTFTEDLAKFESDPAKLEQDKKRREEALIATQKARQQKGQQKERLLQQQKLKEKKMKEQFAKLSHKQE